MFCPLHAKLRIVTNLLVLFLKQHPLQEKVGIIEKKLRGISGNSNFQFRFSPATLEDDHEFDQTKVEVPFLNGTQCSQFLEHFQRFGENLFDTNLFDSSIQPKSRF